MQCDLRVELSFNRVSLAIDSRQRSTTAGAALNLQSGRNTPAFQIDPASGSPPYDSSSNYSLRQHGAVPQRRVNSEGELLSQNRIDGVNYSMPGMTQ